MASSSQKGKNSQDLDDFDEEDESRVCVGPNGVYFEKQLLQIKILIYDQATQNIIAPIFKVGDLRECNVVLNANIKSKREVCPGLPAIYLVEPKQENYELIASDC